MKTRDLIVEYLEYCRYNGNRTGTLVLKDSILRRFADFCPDLPTEPQPIYQFLQLTGRSPASRKSARNIVRAFYTFVCMKYKIPDPMPQVAVPSIRLRVVKAPQVIKCPHCGNSIYFDGYKPDPSQSA